MTRPPERMTVAEFRAAQLKAMSEDDFVDQIVAEAMAAKWLVHHSRPARSKDGQRVFTAIQGHRGLPDLILARAPDVIFAECKSETGTLRPDQKPWRAALEAAPGVAYYLWRPRDLETIRSLLNGP